MKKNIKSKKEMVEFGKKFAKPIKDGAVLGLMGELGAGKTQFTKGLAIGLGVKNVINSPTFVVMKEYKAKGFNKFIHIDCYRLTSSEELLDLGLEEYVGQGNNVIVIEWADKVKEVLPDNTIWLKFEVLGENTRKIIQI